MIKNFKAQSQKRNSKSYKFQELKKFIIKYLILIKLYL